MNDTGEPKPGATPQEIAHRETDIVDTKRDPLTDINFLQKIFSVTEANRHAIEARIVTGRGFEWYEEMLGISPEALRNKDILNFGAGASNIERDLQKKRIPCNVVDVDIKYDPWETSENPFRLFANIPIMLYLKYIRISSEIRKKIVELKRSIAATRDRKFVQGDGRDLPFPSESFDTVLALWSTYQIPHSSKETVYRELMRVGKRLHIGPIPKLDYDLLVKLANEMSYEIVACQPIPKTICKPVPFMFSSNSDYETYMRENDQSSRIKSPKREDVKVSTFLGMRMAHSGGLSSIVLKRASGNPPVALPHRDNDFKPPS
jgi:hypothetical protein